MRIGLSLLLLTSLFCSFSVAQTPTPIRSVTSLPATCKGGSATVPTDVVFLISGGIGVLYGCSSTNTWNVLGLTSASGLTFSSSGVLAGVNATQALTGTDVLYGAIGTIGNTGYLLHLVGVPSAPTTAASIDVNGNTVLLGNLTVGGNTTFNGGTNAFPNGPISVGSATLTATACPSTVTGVWCAAEGSTAGTPTSGVDYIRADSTTHTWKYSMNGGPEITVNVLGATGQASVIPLLIYGSTASSNLAPGYLEFISESGSVTGFFYGSTTFSGQLGIAPSTPTTDVAAGQVLFSQAGVSSIYTTGSASTVGLAECFSGSLTVTDCSSSAQNSVGITEATGNSNTRVKTYGVVTANIPSSTTTAGDYICTGTLSAGTYNLIDNGSTLCPAGTQVGFATATNVGAVTSLKIQLTAATGVTGGTGSGTVSTTGSPASPNLAAMSGATSITNATAHNVAVPLKCADSSGSSTAQSCTTSPSFTPASGDQLTYTTTTSNTSALTVAVNGGSAAAVQKWQGTALASGDIKANTPVSFIFDGTHWQLQNIGNAPSGSGGTFSGSTTTAASATTGVATAANNTPIYGDGSGNVKPAASTTTVGHGGVWSNGAPLSIPITGMTTVAEANSSLTFQQFNLLAPQVLGNATINVSTCATCGETVYFCLYNEAQTTLIWSGSVAVNGLGIYSVNATQVQLEPGVYYAAWEWTGTTAPSVYGFEAGATAANATLNHNGIRVGTAANTISGGVCQSSMGTLTAGNGAGAQAAWALEP